MLRATNEKAFAPCSTPGTRRRDCGAMSSQLFGALAATAVSASVSAPTTAFFKPMYVFNKSLGTTTFEECEEGCPKLDGKSFNKGQMSIPCIMPIYKKRGARRRL